MKNTVDGKFTSSNITPPFPFILYLFILNVWSQGRKLCNLEALFSLRNSPSKCYFQKTYC